MKNSKTISPESKPEINSHAQSRSESHRELLWLNGTIQPLAEARISVEDRGFQFADGVYEVIRAYAGRLFTLDEHLQRLLRSCSGIGIELPMRLDDLAGQIRLLLERSGVKDGWIYLQVTRGPAPRNHLFPANPRPTVLFYARPIAAAADTGQKLITVADDRWRRCWIKAIALLPNVLAKNQAAAEGADEALFVEDEIVSECASSNFFAVMGGKVITAPVGPKVLPGITRQVLLKLAPAAGIEIIERPPRLQEIKTGDELFITSTTREINWVSSLDSQAFARGPITERLHAALRAYIST